MSTEDNALQIYPGIQQFVYSFLCAGLLLFLILCSSSLEAAILFQSAFFFQSLSSSDSGSYALINPPLLSGGGHFVSVSLFLPEPYQFRFRFLCSYSSSAPPWIRPFCSSHPSSSRAFPVQIQVLLFLFILCSSLEAAMHFVPVILLLPEPLQFRFRFYVLIHLWRWPFCSSHPSSSRALPVQIQVLMFLFILFCSLRFCFLQRISCEVSFFSFSAQEATTVLEWQIVFFLEKCIYYILYSWTGNNRGVAVTGGGLVRRGDNVTMKLNTSAGWSR